MPAPSTIVSVQNTGSQTLTTTTEAVIATLANINLDSITPRVSLSGTVNVLAGTGTTAITLRIRRAGLTGALVGTANLNTLAAGSTFTLSVEADDSPGESAGATYVVTAQQTGASANGTVNQVNAWAIVH